MYAVRSALPSYLDISRRQMDAYYQRIEAEQEALRIIADMAREQAEQEAQRLAEIARKAAARRARDAARKRAALEAAKRIKPSSAERMAQGEEIRKNWRIYSVIDRHLIEDIIKHTAAHFKISAIDLLSRRHARYVSYPRQIAMHLSKELTIRPLGVIGRIFDRDHTTVLYATGKMAGLVKTDEKVAADVAAIKKRLGAE